MSSPPEWSDPAWCEREYNPRLTVADAPALLAQWGARAAEARARLPHVADIEYGVHPRERIDLFPAAHARGLIIFLHGGYWRALSKHEHSWVAEQFVAAGISVALVNYPLCPEVTVAQITDSCRRAVAQIWRDADPAERAQCLVSGHSAGGYLTAAMFATDWTEHGLPREPFCGGLSISGVFDPTPLIHTSMNELIRLTPESAAALDLTRAQRLVHAPLVLTVGGDEPAEFHRQSRDMARAWTLPAGAVRPMADTNHFTIVDQLRDPASAMNLITMKLLAGHA